MFTESRYWKEDVHLLCNNRNKDANANAACVSLECSDLQDELRHHDDLASELHIAEGSSNVSFQKMSDFNCFQLKLRRLTSKR